jgi:hypothetical protein
MDNPFLEKKKLKRGQLSTQSGVATDVIIININIMQMYEPTSTILQNLVGFVICYQQNDSHIKGAR